MKTQFTKVDYSLSTLLDYIELGIIGLPDIQRPFIWKTTKVRDLFDSMYKGYPVGYLLFWENALANGGRKIGTDKKQKIPRLLIVDGQQRLTSLYAVLKGKSIIREDYSEQKIVIAFRPLDATFAVTDAAILRDPEYITDISQLWTSEIGRTMFVEDFISRLRKSRVVDEIERCTLSEIIDRLYDLKDYPFTALELFPSVGEEQVSDVFVRVNSAGITLNQADFILTLMSVFWDKGRKDLEDFCRRSRFPSNSHASPYNHFIEPSPDQLLRVGVGIGFYRARLKYVYSILRGKDLETEQFSEERRIQQFEILKQSQGYSINLQNWQDFFKTLMQAGFRSSAMITSHTALLYTYIFYLIGKRNFNIEESALRHILARWFYMVTLTMRYSATPETQMEEDLNKIRGINRSNAFFDLLEKIIGDTLTEDFWNITLPNNLVSSSVRSPALFAYNATLNLVGANVLFSKLKVAELLDPAIKSNKSSIERHHLFPKAYLKKIGIVDNKEINQIANYAYVEWKVNIDIQDKPPSTYVLPHSKPFTKKEIEQMSYWHALPDGWENMDYSEFLIKRRKMIAHIIKEGYLRLSS